VADAQDVAASRRQQHRLPIGLGAQRSSGHHRRRGDQTRDCRWDGYAAFVRYGNNETLLMGDLVITEAELPNVTDALQSHGIAQTALHKHLLAQTRPVWWTHVHGMDDATQLAQAFKAALDATPIGPAAPPPAQQPPVDIDTAGVEQALGRKGTPDGGLFKHSIAARTPSSTTRTCCLRRR
jgi:Domain of Unknown Function (DUF1259)